MKREKERGRKRNGRSEGSNLGVLDKTQKEESFLYYGKKWLLPRLLEIYGYGSRLMRKRWNLTPAMEDAGADSKFYPELAFLFVGFVWPKIGINK